MLQMRARGFCARDGVPDVLHGLYIREERKAPAALGPDAPGDVISDPQDFLSDLDVSLTASRTDHQLDEVWAENLATICSLGMQLRQKAELIYERHQCRISGRMDSNAAEKHSGAAV
jgi:hypothetical protein